MKSKVNAGFYVLLIVFAAFSMGYYIAGALAMREEFFHASRYARPPFDFHDDGQTLNGLRKEATVAGSIQWGFPAGSQRSSVYRHMLRSTTS